MRPETKLRHLIVLACAIPVLAHADVIKRMRQPALSPDGKTIAFAWQGDIWTVSSKGGRAQRLTVNPSDESSPKWFPDGSRIAFASNRYGSSDVFTMKSDGTDIKRLTFDSAGEAPSCVDADGKTIYGQTSIWGRLHLFKVNADGGEPIQLTDASMETEYLPSLSADGKTVFYNRGSYGSGAWHKPSIVSSALPEIWAADNTVPLSHHRRLTNNERTDLSPQAGPDGSITYISNADGWPNVWRMEGSSTKQLTHHTDGTSHDPSISADGRYVSYLFNSEIYVYDTKTGTDTKLTVDVPSDARNNPVADLSLSTGATDYAISPDGKRAVVVVRGDLFLLPEKGGTTRRLTTNPAWDFQPVWLDNKTVLYVTSANGHRELRTVSVDGTIKPFVTDAANLTHPQVSPDGKLVAFHRGDSEIVVVPASGGTPKTVLKGNFGEALDGDAMFSWSPDSLWIAANVIEGRRVDVVLAQVNGEKKVNVAKLVYKPQGGSASTPRFLPNGKGVYFTSPEFDQPDLFVVDLVPAELTFSEDDLDKLDEKKKEDKGDAKVDVYEPGIEYRLRRLTANGAGDALAAPDSRTITTVVNGQVVSVSVATGNASPIAAIAGPASNLQLGKESKKLYYLSGGRLYGLATGAPAPSAVSFSAQYSVNLRDEEASLFQDVSWAMETLYYDPQLHGKKWPQIKAKFAALVPYTYDRGDFYDLLEELMEELDSSHLGSTAPREDVPGQGSEPTGYLGISFDPKALDALGSYVVARVTPQSPADDPQSQIRVGDKVLAADGVKPSPSKPFASLLVRKSGKRVVLSIERDGKPTTVTIKPASSAVKGTLDYEAWVASERSLVDKYSGGTVGYLHIKGMDEPSLARFLREIRTQAEGKKAVLLDCRYNGGGSTAVQILNVLIRRPWLVRTTRGEFGAKLSENIWRSDALELPTGLLVNTFSFSNAEIIAEGFRQLQRGPIVGERTPGYVIGTGGYGLWDGGFIRMPRIGAFTVKGEDLENSGRRPDYTVWFDPNAWAAGEDPQLKKAVEAVLSQGTK